MTKSSADKLTEVTSIEKVKLKLAEFLKIENKELDAPWWGGNPHRKLKENLI